jgi:mono/diheme cytochrome c family protein
MFRLSCKIWLILLGVGLIAGLGTWKSAVAAGPGPGQSNLEGAVVADGGGRLGPASQENAGMKEESVGRLAQMGRGGMMGGQGYCGPGMGAYGRQGAQGQPQGGAGLFSANCASCHPGGGNTIVPDLPIQGSPQLESFGAFRAYVRNPTLPDGEQGAMPSFSSRRISDQQMRELYQYLKSRYGR